MKFLKNKRDELNEQYQNNFQNGLLVDEANFHRDSECYRVLSEIIYLEYEDMEAYHDQTGMGSASSEAE